MATNLESTDFLKCITLFDGITSLEQVLNTNYSVRLIYLTIEYEGLAME